MDLQGLINNAVFSDNFVGESKIICVMSTQICGKKKVALEVMRLVGLYHYCLKKLMWTGVVFVFVYNSPLTKPGSCFYKQSNLSKILYHF